MSLMWQEIWEQPSVLERTLQSEWARAEQLRRYLERKTPRYIVLVARGTSDNAAQFGRYLLEITTGIPVGLAAASVATLYQSPLRLADALVVGVSQSGESTDTNLFLERARAAGATTIGITNEADSHLARLAEHTFLVRAGRERSVAATKTYTGQLLCFYLLAYALGAPIAGTELQQLAGSAQSALELDPVIQERAGRYRFLQRTICIGRGLNYANSFEAALKLMETCYVVAERFSSADLLHGPIAMLDESIPAFAFCPAGVTWETMKALLEKLESIKVETLAITDDAHPAAAELRRLTRHVFSVGVTVRASAGLPADVYTPIPYVIPMQLLAARLAEAKGLDPDKPRTLSKVTRTL